MITHDPSEACIQVTWSLMTNKRPVHSSHDHSEPSHHCSCCLWRVDQTSWYHQPWGPAPAARALGSTQYTWEGKVSKWDIMKWNVECTRTWASDPATCVWPHWRRSDAAGCRGSDCSAFLAGGVHKWRVTNKWLKYRAHAKLIGKVFSCHLWVVPGWYLAKNQLTMPPQSWPIRVNLRTWWNSLYFQAKVQSQIQVPNPGLKSYKSQIHVPNSSPKTKI